MYSETSTSILNRMLAAVPSDLDTFEGSLIYDALAPFSLELSRLTAKLEDLAGKFDLSNLGGEELETRIRQQTGLSRKAATCAAALVTVTGNGIIKAGELVQTPGGIRFKVLTEQTVAGLASVPVQAVSPGSNGNLPAGQLTQFPVAIPGLVSVTNTEPTQGGYDAESDTALLQRYDEHIRRPATGGNIAQFTSLIKDYPGVGDVKVYPTWNGNNTVKLVIIDANKHPPSPELVASTQAYMDPGAAGLGQGKAPFGAMTTVVGATGKTLNIHFTVVKDTNYTDEQRLASVQDRINVYLAEIAFQGSSVSYGKIGAAILASAGVLDYSGLTLNGGSANIPLIDTKDLTETPVLGVLTIV